MNGPKTYKKDYFFKIAGSIRDLWNAQEILAARNIRRSGIQYFLAFPFSMIFINIQNLILRDEIGILGVSHTTATFSAFAAGAFVMFAFAKEANIAVISKLSASIAACGFIPWLFLSGSQYAIISDMVFMGGIGGCLSCSSFSFVFMLNNSERFFSMTLVLIVIDVLEQGADFFVDAASSRKIIAIMLITVICVCMYRSKKEDFLNIAEGKTKVSDSSIGLVVFLFFSYFAVRITGFYAPAFQHPKDSMLWGFAALLLIIGSILVLVVCRRSIWNLCNVFFVSSILSYLSWYAGMSHLAYMFSELKEIGLVVVFYLIGCITNKFCDFRMHKRMILVCMTVVGVLYLGTEILKMTDISQTVAVATAVTLFIIFLLLSPAYSQRLFFTDWSEGLKGGRMIDPGDEQNVNGRSYIDDPVLSPREKQVVELMLKGMTARQIAPELGLTPSTVSTYSKTIYKKLGINSRAELFMKFGPIHNKK